MILDAQTIYVMTGAVVFAIGLRGALHHHALLGSILGFNVGGMGLFLALIALAYRGASEVADPVPQALVLTGIVVAVSATALAIALARRLQGQKDE